MLRDRIYDYYINKDFNCAESLLHAANDEYGFEIPKDAFKLVGGFGAGLGCGHTCGVLLSGVSAIGRACIEERAHKTEKLKGYCTDYVNAFTKELGSENCSELMAKYKKEDVRCLNTVLMAADVLEKIMSEIQKPSLEEPK